MRFNQPFGDGVGWDLIPDIAIDTLTVEGSNPVFGLNALGGSISLQMKNGFKWQGAELEASGGSFDRYDVEGQFRPRDGPFSVYVAEGRCTRPAGASTRPPAWDRSSPIWAGTTGAASCIST